MRSGGSPTAIRDDQSEGSVALSWHQPEYRIIGYSVGNLGKNLVLSSLDLTLLFMLTDLIRLDPISVSILMSIVFLGDLTFDLAAGYVATWAHQRAVGHRKVIALGVIPCSLAFTLLYSLPWLGTKEMAVVAATLLVFRATYAIIDVPHNSLLGRVAADSRARGRASGYRLFFSTVSGLIIALVVAPAVIGADRHFATGSVALVGAGCGTVSCLALWIAAWSARSERPAVHQVPRPIAVLPKLDGLFAAMVSIAFVIGFAMPTFGRMMIYQTTYVLGQPGLTGRLLLAVTLGQFPGVLIWTILVRHCEKTRLLGISSGCAIAAMLLFVALEPQPAFLTAAAFLVGLCLTGVYMLPWAILADAIDFAEFRHGERREAAAIAAFLVALKAGGAASLSVIAWSLDHLGYVVGAKQNAVVVAGIKALSFGIPVAGAVVAMIVSSRMSIGHDGHARVLRALTRRHAPCRETA
ncbi:sugar:proton symporter [Nostoc sp. 3335mG]|nr:sugar:proton symporter [Nostoc sp. 3335mG]